MLITVLFSYSGVKKEKGETGDIDDVYKLLIQEIIEYDNYYDFNPQDTLLIGAEVTHFREAQPREKESWSFEYDENNKRIKETHFLNQNDSMILTYSKEFSNGTEKEFRIEDGDTLYVDQIAYNNTGNVIHFKTKYSSKVDKEYFDYIYDDQNKLVQMKIVDYITNKIDTI